MTSARVLIVGTGFAGLGMAIRLKQAGIEDFVVLEQADRVGGTWRDNHYPGAACDVMSHLYSFSFEPKHDWSRTFAEQTEILAYLDHCADRYDVRRFVRFRTAATSARFDEATGVWVVTTSAGDVIHARYVVSGCGGLSKPSYPAIPGLDRFRGKTMHSARWDTAHRLEGERVGVVGTGASAIQIVPAIAARVGRLDVYQRTPPWILPKDDRPIGATTQALYRRLPRLMQLERAKIYWRNELVGTGLLYDRRLLALGQRFAERHLRAAVRDPVLRAKLTPNYTMGCKRVLLSNDYYAAVQRPNVDVVTDGIAEVREHGILTTRGEERPLDTLVFATGFQAAEQVAPFPVVGRGGRELDAHWRDGAAAYRGTAVSGFPNFFFIVGPNTGLGHSSMVIMIEAQIGYIADAIRTLDAREAKFADVRSDVEHRYNARIQARLAKTVWQTGGCTSWYQTSSGKNTTLWPGYTTEFRWMMRAFDPENYEIVARDTRSEQRGGRAVRAGDAPRRAAAAAAAAGGALREG